MPQQPPTRTGGPAGRRTSDAIFRYAAFVIALIGTGTLLYLGKNLFILLFLAGVFSFLLLPFCRFLQRKGWPIGLAAGASCLLLLVGFFLLLSLLGWQYARFGKDLPMLTQALSLKIDSLQAYLEQRFHVSQGQQIAWLQQELASLAKSGGALAMSFFAATGAVLTATIFVPILTFFLLLLKGRFRTFFTGLHTNRHGAVIRIVENIAQLSRKWLWGVLVVAFFVALLDTIGFVALGLKYALLLGATAGLLNVIPYLGPWLAAIVPTLIALLTKDSAFYALGVLLVIGFTQFLESNFITPKVVGGSVRINVLVSTLALLVWGALWGLMGLILAIPITGMIKIVLDEIPGTRAWGFLLGDEKHLHPPLEQREAAVATTGRHAGGERTGKARERRVRRRNR